jgi:lipoate-protein ligase A
MPSEGPDAVGRGNLPSIDTGLRSGAQNNAFDREWLRLACLGECGSLLRFHRSLPAASVGRHQALDRELRLDHCERQGLEILRRPTGGGALYLDPDCLCFSLTLAGKESPAGGIAEILARAGQAVGEALRRLGVGCAFKAPNDLEACGGKIASVFAAAGDGAWLVQGTVLMRADVRAMLEALRVPTEKLSPDGLAAARERLATLSQCLGGVPREEAVRAALEQGLADVFGLRLCRADGVMDAGFPERAEEAERAFARSLQWGEAEGSLLEAVWKGGGATLRARGGFNRGGHCFRNVELAGDLHLAPQGWLEGLQTGLEGLPAGLVRHRVEDSWRRHRPQAVGAGVEDFIRVLELLAEKRVASSALGLSDAQANALMLHGAHGGLREILAQATVMLVPYCAKPGWCKWRHLDGCSECGLCEVGEAYRLARERGMEVTTVTRYEHLVATLEGMRNRRVPAYVGMCCSNFFIKRQRAFRDAGIPALLMDISGANCYELKQEDQAYAGTFSAEAKLDLEVLRKVMRFVPPVADRPRDGETETGALEGGAPRG